MTAMADETSLKNKHLGNGDYFASIAFYLHSVLFTNYSRSAVEFKIENERFIVGVVIKTLNVETSRCCLADYVKEFY